MEFFSFVESSEFKPIVLVIFMGFFLLALTKSERVVLPGNPFNQDVLADAPEPKFIVELEDEPTFSPVVVPVEVSNILTKENLKQIKKLRKDLQKCTHNIKLLKSKLAREELSMTQQIMTREAKETHSAKMTSIKQGISGMKSKLKK